MKTAVHVMLTLVFLAAAGVMIWQAATAPSTAPQPVVIPRPEHPEAMDPMIRELVMQRLGELEKSLTEARRWTALGWAYHANGLLELALPCYEQASILEPQEARWLYYQGLLRADQGRHEQAVALFKRVTELQEGFGPGFWRLGLAQLQVDDIPNAEVSFSMASRLDMESAVPITGLALVAIKKKQDQEAVSWLENVLNQHHDLAYAKQLLADCYERLGRKNEAEWWRRDGGVTQEPRWHDDWEYKIVESMTGRRFAMENAQMNLSAGRPKSAIDRLEKARPYWPDDAELLALLSRADLEYGKYDAVLEATGHAMQSKGVAPEVTASLLMMRGRALARLNRWAEAAAVFKELTLMPTATGEAFLGLAQAKIELHVLNEAAEALAQAKALGGVDAGMLKQVDDAFNAAAAAVSH